MLKSAADHVRLRLPPAPKAAAAAAAAAAGEPLLCRRSSVLVVFVCELSFRYVLGKVQKAAPCTTYEYRPPPNTFFRE